MLQGTFAGKQQPTALNGHPSSTVHYMFIKKLNSTVLCFKYHGVLNKILKMMIN